MPVILGIEGGWWLLGSVGAWLGYNAVNNGTTTAGTIAGEGISDAAIIAGIGIGVAVVIVAVHLSGKK